MNCGTPSPPCCPPTPLRPRAGGDDSPIASASTASSSSSAKVAAGNRCRANAAGGGSGSTCWRRFREWTQAGVWEKTHAQRVVALGERGLLNLDRAVVDSCSVRALRGGEHTGANPTDRAKKGCKRHLITAGHGLPLVVQIGPANRRDEQWLPCLLWWLWIVLRCGWRHRPAALQGDRGYGFAGSIALVLAWGLRSLLAERGSPHGSGLGRTR